MAGQVRLTLLAPFADFAGKRETSIPVEGPLPAETFLGRVEARFPALRPYFAPGRNHEEVLLLVINGQAAGREATVHPGDEVLLCPQVSGG